MPLNLTVIRFNVIFKQSLTILSHKYLIDYTLNISNDVKNLKVQIILCIESLTGVKEIQLHLYHPCNVAVYRNKS